MSIEAAFFGTLGRDAEAKTSKNGKPYLRFICRTGEGDAAQWISVMAFDERATDQADKFTKGARCYVEGSLKLDEWAGQDGAKRHGLSCMSWHCKLIGIGHNKPRRPRPAAEKPSSAPASRDDFPSDPIGF
jgi:single-stranded DNA-binding protein